MAPRLAPLVGAARHMTIDEPGSVPLTRPLLGRILSECAIFEEFLDSFGARNNSRHHLLREIVSAGRIFAAAGYKLLHISHSLPRYHLQNNSDDFVADTQKALDYVSRVICCVMGHLLRQAAELGLAGAIPETNEDFSEFEEVGILACDRTTRTVESPEETVVELCTELLDISSAAAALGLARVKRVADYRKLIPDTVNDEAIRKLEYQFHHFKSTYDSDLSNTELEAIDKDLPRLRGHVSVVSHLVEAASHLVHFYQRHLLPAASASQLQVECPVDADGLLLIIFGYLGKYGRHYAMVARALCQRILAKYSEVGSRELPIPQYRGFHVRPSTLVAKIARHYGTGLRMELLGQVYDASMPLELFRANEAINALKRRRMAEKIATLDLPGNMGTAEESIEAVRGAVLKLAEKRELVIYEQPLPLERNGFLPEANLFEYCIEKMKKLLALGKIDLDIPLTATFTGDTRVLRDVEKLAQAGYGEDRLGHNIPLPDDLAYLRRFPDADL